MTLPTINLALSAIQTEFGGVNPISLSEYYRGAGGGYVPAGQATSTTDGTAVAASGLIRMGEFRGLTKGGILASYSYSAAASGLASGSPASTIAHFDANGGISLTVNNGTAGTFTPSANPPGWYTPTTGIGSSYWINVTAVVNSSAGTGFGISNGYGTSWVSLASTASFGVSVNNVATGSIVATFTIKISSNSTGTAIVSTGTIQLAA